MRGRSDVEPVVLLTVEEAAELLRIGRTKAYAMAREWRATGGETGLPVVDFGNVLRVPVSALAKLLGVEPAVLLAEVAARIRANPPATPLPAPAKPTPTPTRRTPTCATHQLDLFEHPAAS